MLPALADTLGLSDRQVDRLQGLRHELMSQHRTHRQEMMAEQQQLQGLFEGGDSPSPDVLRERLTIMADRWVGERVSTYDVAQRMRGVLTAEQRERLDAMTPQQQMRQMMSHMPMMDMMRMMRSMHGGMMGPAMMQHRQMMHSGMMQRGGMGGMNRPGGQQRQNQ